MNFLLPLALLGGISLPILLIFYLLKVKRKPARVSSTFLWREAVDDARASVPFQKLRRNLLMILQLLTLALLTLALARPILNLLVREQSSALVLIDTSASMGARGPASGRTRLEVARKKASDFISAMPLGSQAMVIAFSDRAHVNAPFTSDRAKLRSAIRDLKVEAAADDLRSAMALAGSLLSSAPRPRIVVFSDRVQPPDEVLDPVAGTSIVFEMCGEEAENFGWTAMDVRQSNATSGNFDLFGQVALNGAKPAEAIVQVEGDGEILDVRRIGLVPGEETGVVVENLSLNRDGMIRATVAAVGDFEDALAMDNEVWARSAPPREVRILLCTPGNYFLSRALATAGSIEVTELSEGQEVPNIDFDLAIFDRGLPDTIPDVPAIYIGSESLWMPTDAEVDEDAESGETGVGSITSWAPDHPVTRDVQWSTMTVYGVRQLAPPPGTQVLVEAGDVPLICLGRVGDQPALVIAFDLFRSNFPLRSGFPIFVKSAIDWMRRERARRDIVALRGGEPWSTATSSDIKRVKIISPAGRVWNQVPGPDGIVSFSETYETGVWSVEFDGKATEEFAVNLMNPEESKAAIDQQMRITSSGETETAGLDAELRTNREIWKWFAAAALALLVAEWVFYRRAYAT